MHTPPPAVAEAAAGEAAGITTEAGNRGLRSKGDPPLGDSAVAAVAAAAAAVCCRQRLFRSST